MVEKKKGISTIILGDSKVGKTSILQAIENKGFNESHITTMGVDFKTVKWTDPQGNQVDVKLWDTAGQERFRTITYSFYKNANGVILCFDLTSQESFKNVKSWLDGIYQHTDPDIVKVLVGNKSDLAEHREVTYEQAMEVAEQHKMEYFETSAKTRENIDNLSQSIFSSIYKRMSVPSSQLGDPAHAEAGPSNKNNGSVVISRLS